ncbi:hypothetical protein [Siphonobacter sp. SORGH_AS_0500]|uniref:hypothetical protein n=1 Tax=Siphonobacter sp. SORGH_AS_0500 TaxID=1864824 RepID=UPI0028632758|nr:hypothetical protein [Siphonobacter sp. SORGH_AS_0500]MDR6195059.1 hypothetical protein [Siphonobacter sp. SORGH_AS_0500]
MNIRNPLFVITLLLLGSLNVFAQQKRLEIPIPSSNANIFTIPVGQEGVMLLTQTGRNSYHIDRFDTNLERSWSVDGTITDGLEYVTYSYDGKNIYLLFSRNKSNVYEIIKVYVGPGFTEKFEIHSVDKMEISQFKAFHDGIYIAGVVREQPILSYTNLQTRQNRLLNASFKGKAEVQAIEVDSVTNRVNVTYAVQQKNREFSIVVKSFDDEGKQLSEIVVTPDEDYALLDGRLSPLPDGTQLMIGTYGYRSMQSQTKGHMVQGIYLCKVTDKEILPLKYYSFTDFKNFFSYLSPRDQERRERQVQRKKEKGSDLKLNTQLLLHDLIQKDGQLILVAEAFQATFRNNSNAWGYGSPWGSPMGGFYPGWGWGMYSLNPFYFGNRGFYNNGAQMFDGWQYTHAVVAGIDPEKATLIWDNSFEIDKVKTMSLKEKVKANVQNNQVTLVYSDNGSLRSKSIKNNMVVEDGTAQALATGNTGDRVRRNSTENVDYWYDNYFLAWGFQRITNDAEGRRNVFYLNKVAY